MKMPKTPITRVIERPAGMCRTKWWVYYHFDDKEVVAAAAPTRFMAIRWAVKRYRRDTARAVARALA